MKYEYDGTNGGFRPQQTEPQDTVKPQGQQRTAWEAAAKQQEQKARQNAKKRQTNSDVGAWVIIAFLFLFGLWPIGLVLLISKLVNNSGKKSAKGSSAARKSVAKVTRSPEDSTKSARVMKIVGGVLVALGALMATRYVSDLGFYIRYGDFWWFFEDMFPALGFLSGGIAMLVGGQAMTRRMRRFAKYLAAAGKRESVSISRLAAAAEVSERRVEKDLELMVEKGLWGKRAYLDIGAGRLFRSADAAADYFASKEQPVTPKETETGYSGVLRQIRNVNDRIADPELSAKIDRLEEVAGRIFRLVESQPEKKAKASTFLNYYLPTTQKLLDSYAEFEEAGVSGENLNQAKNKIRKTMDNIVAGFERQLDELYRADAMDIDSDIRVMESMLRRDRASAAEDFGLDDSGAVQQSLEDDM